MICSRGLIATLIIISAFAAVNANKANESGYARVPKTPFQIGSHHQIAISSNEEASEIKPIRSQYGKTWKSLQYTLSHEGASYLSVHLKEISLPSSCILVISDPFGKQRTVMGGQEGKYDRGSFWAHHVSGDLMELMLECYDNFHEVKFEIDGYVAGFPKASGDSGERAWDRTLIVSPNGDIEDDRSEREMSICQKDDKLSPKCIEDSHPMFYNKAKAVARLLVNGSGLCTGWLVGENNMLMTNDHCISSQADVENTDFEFMAESYCENGTFTNTSQIFDGVSLVKHSSFYDYALVQLAGNPAELFG